MASYEEEYQKMQCVTQQYVEEICKIWQQTFDPDTCKEHMRKLIEHATNFYSDLVRESIGRKECILEEINELKKEAEDLKRLLHVNVELPCYGTDNVPLLRVQSEMDKGLASLREEMRLRKEEICELLLQQESLCEELGESPRALLDDPLPTAEELEDFKKHLGNLRSERKQRIEKIVTFRREIRNFLDILDLPITSESDDRLLNNRQIKFNLETLDSLRKMHSIYALQVQDLKESINSMRHKLESLWERLQTSPNTRQKFDRYIKYNQHACRAIYNELQRCEQLKRQNIKQFVHQIREEMREWWDKCLKSDKERERFSYYTCNTYSDDLLVLHEMELHDLKLQYDTYKQIYDLYADRNILWDRMSALEAKASEPGRYNNRGGQLLKEEKERKIISTKLPKLEQKIVELVKEYEEKEHRHFLVYGENIIDVMADQWEKKRQEKEQVQTARKNAATGSAVKPSSTLRNPMLLKNATPMTSLRKPLFGSSLSVHQTTSSQRKLQLSENTTPSAKRSLLHALNSPSLSLKPSTSKNIVHTPSRPVTRIKSNLKRPRPVIGSTIRRRSGRQSSGIKKRKSINNSNSHSKIVPKIVIQDCATSDGYTTEYNEEDTYDSFQPASRSSMIPNSSASSRIRRMQKVVADENERLAKSPRPQMIRNRTNSSISNLARTPNSNTSHLPLSSRGRKLTTKNLPIII